MMQREVHDDAAKHWQRLLREWKKSGLSQAEFCRRRGITAMTFYWWKRQLKDRLAGVRRPSGRKVGGTSRRPGGHGAAFIAVMLAGTLWGAPWLRGETLTVVHDTFEQLDATTRDRFIAVDRSPAGIRLSRSYLVTNEMGVTGRATIVITE